MKLTKNTLNRLSRAKRAIEKTYQQKVLSRCHHGKDDWEFILKNMRIGKIIKTEWQSL